MQDLVLRDIHCTLMKLISGRGCLCYRSGILRHYDRRSSGRPSGDRFIRRCCSENSEKLRHSGDHWRGRENVQELEIPSCDQEVYDPR